MCFAAFDAIGPHMTAVAPVVYGVDHAGFLKCIYDRAFALCAVTTMFRSVRWRR